MNSVMKLNNRSIHLGVSEVKDCKVKIVKKMSGTIQNSAFIKCKLYEQFFYEKNFLGTSLPQISVKIGGKPLFNPVLEVGMVVAIV